MELTTATLHHVIVDTLLTRGWAPRIDEMAERFGAPRGAVLETLEALAEDHGVVLHPHDREVWVVHPFSTVPTGFLVRSGGLEWWGNCAWCSLGIAALAGPEATITTSPGFDSPQVTLRIEGGRLLDTGYVVHFPTPMVRAWDNVLNTCALMLLFEDAEAVDRWCARHGKPRGDVRPVEQVWHFAAEWYGRHRDPDWRKWTGAEAAAIFARHGLDGPIWDLPAAEARF